MDDSRHPNACVTCPTIRPDAEPRLPHNPPVCDGDRALLDRWLTDIANLHHDLANPAPIESDRRRYERWGRDNQDRRPVSLGETWADPLAQLGGVGPINSRKNNQPSVSGSRERPLPISADTVDLTGDARQPNPTIAARQHPDDQTGHLSAATTLDSWVRDWRDTLWPDHHLPVATVDELVSWLRHRLWDACDHHPAIDEFAAEIRALRSALRRAAGEGDQRPQLCEGVDCPRCGLRMMYRRPDGTGDVDCHNPDCQAVYGLDAYRELVAEQVAASRPA